MNYGVKWSRSTRLSLASIWLVAPNRNAVTKAQARIDHLLSVDPVSHSQPVSEGLFAIEVHPLRVIFELNEVTRTVEIVGISQLP